MGFGLSSDAFVSPVASEINNSLECAVALFWWLARRDNHPFLRVVGWPGGGRVPDESKITHPGWERNVDGNTSLKRLHPFNLPPHTPTPHSAASITKHPPPPQPDVLLFNLNISAGVFFYF